MPSDQDKRSGHGTSGSVTTARRDALRTCWRALDVLLDLKDELGAVVEVDQVQPVTKKLDEAASAVRQLIGTLTEDEQ